MDAGGSSSLPVNPLSTREAQDHAASQAAQLGQLLNAGADNWEEQEKAVLASAGNTDADDEWKRRFEQGISNPNTARSNYSEYTSDGEYTNPNTARTNATTDHDSDSDQDIHVTEVKESPEPPPAQKDAPPPLPQQVDAPDVPDIAVKSERAERSSSDVDVAVLKALLERERQENEAMKQKLDAMNRELANSSKQAGELEALQRNAADLASQLASKQAEAAAKDAKLQRAMAAEQERAASRKTIEQSSSRDLCGRGRFCSIGGTECAIM